MLFGRGASLIDALITSSKHCRDNKFNSYGLHYEPVFGLDIWNM